MPFDDFAEDLFKQGTTIVRQKANSKLNHELEDALGKIKGSGVIGGMVSSYVRNIIRSEANQFFSELDDLLFNKSFKILTKNLEYSMLDNPAYRPNPLQEAALGKVKDYLGDWNKSSSTKISGLDDTDTEGAYTTLSLFRQDSGTEKNPHRSAQVSFKLPLPEKLGSNSTYDWEKIDMGLINELIDGWNQGTGVISGVTGAAERAMKYELRRMAGAKLGKLYREWGGKGSSVNPNEEVWFKGISLREYSMTFDIASKSMDKMAANIAAEGKIRKLLAPRLSTADDASDASYFYEPFRAEVSIHANGKTIWQPRIVVVKSMDTDLNPDGAFNTFENGAPIHFKMTFNFMEVTLATQEDRYDAWFAEGTE